MQAAAIYYDKKQHALTLEDLKQILVKLGCEVENTQWQLEHIVIPQLKITKPLYCLMQIHDDVPEDLCEEASEIADHLSEQLTDEQISGMKRCNARIEIGEIEEEDNEDDEGIVGDDLPLDLSSITFDDSELFDPAHENTKKILLQISQKLNGYFFDNFNGLIYSPEKA